MAAAIVFSVVHVAYAEDLSDLNLKAIAILRRECVSCHGPDKQEANLRLDSLAGFVAGGDSGPVVALGTEAADKASLLVERIEHEDAELLMPPKRRLHATELAILKAWVESGAHWHVQETQNAMVSTKEVVLGDAWSDPKNPIRVLFDGKRLELWSLRPIRRPDIPTVLDSAWCRNPIDSFILEKWERDGLTPAPIAPDEVLVRRLSLDTMGLPADHSHVQYFVQDNATDKYDRLIDRMLSSPAFGIHMARMWLDVVRYSDSNGFDWDELRPNAWMYRDYVVRALNNDEPFDRFIEKQLAGDELQEGPPRNTDEQDQLIATGYLRLGPRDNAAGLFNEQDRARAELMSDLTETTASAMLGLTMSCCRCHDHKTDPLSHADHYRLRAFFVASHDTDEVAVDLQDVQETIQAHNDKVELDVNKVKATMDDITERAQSRQPSKRKPEKIKELMSADEREQLERAESELKSLEKTKLPFTKGFLMHDDKLDVVPQTHILVGGDYRLEKDVVEPGFPAVLFPNDATMVERPKANTTGRRLTLARWLGSRENPWTARVIVNRVWQNYFGQGIVATPNDFGVTGALPTHPELLDYLAMELIDSGWSLKHIHRLIVSSNAYRQQSIANLNAENSRSMVTLRNHLRRKSAEQLRDSILQVSGLLQERVGGAPVWPVLDHATLAANPAVLDDNETKTKGWYPSPASDQTVRSLYLIQKRTIRIPWLETFDLPENAASCGRRECSLVAPQSLAMMNGELSVQASKQLAIEIERLFHNNHEGEVQELFQRILARNPRDQELESCRLFLKTRSLLELSLVLLNTNEFVFSD
ncbi:MAG: PSD1 and planctomycete cytochrome C domain-containing protein [Planctomycetota bacterium]|nr:PSD1 and planctomycete cytochrome C domain-containing protein [Planctomycetota bacterium]